MAQRGDYGSFVFYRVGNPDRSGIVFVLSVCVVELAYLNFDSLASNFYLARQFHGLLNHPLWMFQIRS